MTAPPGETASRGLKDGYQRFFAWAMATGTADYERAMAERKQALFAGLEGEVLEIGPGAGPNLPYLNPNVRWLGIEPNPHMHPYLQAAAAQAGVAVDLRVGNAEALPASDSSIDAVISTLVLCSVPNLPRSLAEIYRVLKPGGRFLFIEHVAASRETFGGTVLRQVQNGIRPFWQLIGDGCQPNRDTGELIRQTGFSKVDYETFKAPVPIAIVQPHILGVAVK
jgi:ubiquinone/menaquinone biosynthesis C-methylase UbiE